MNNSEYNLTSGMGRTQVSLQAIAMGEGLVVRIYNENPHIGAISLGEYDFTNQRPSVSVVTRLGHKDDTLAQKAAYTLTKATHKTVCVVAGIHIDNITDNEITDILANSDRLVKDLLKQLNIP
jgi:gallate decarboxylase subunit D